MEGLKLVDVEAETGPLQIGQVFRTNYEIRALIGRGGHAWVYQARHRFLGHHVATKILHRQGGVSRDMLRRGQAEAQIQHKLNHPNIVAVDDAGTTEEGLFYIVMELLRGRAFRSVIEEYGRLEVEEVLRIGMQITDAMQAAHDAGVIHRDIKPENVFVTPDGVKVLDFGIAKIVDRAAWVTAKDIVLGTMLYMSPEQLQARPLGPQSDIYSLGILMYEALLGQHPVQMLVTSPEPTLYDISRVVVREPTPLLNERDARIPRYIAALVNTAIVKLAEQRFDSMRAFGVAIRECLAQYESDMRRMGRSVQVRDLSRRTTPRSGVEVNNAMSPAPAVPAVLGNVSGGADTAPSSRPAFLGAASSGVLAPHIAPAPRAADVPVQPAKPPGGIMARAMRTEPLPLTPEEEAAERARGLAVRPTERAPSVPPPVASAPPSAVEAFRQPPDPTLPAPTRTSVRPLAQLAPREPTLEDNAPAEPPRVSAVAPEQGQPSKGGLTVTRVALLGAGLGFVVAVLAIGVSASKRFASAPEASPSVVAVAPSAAPANSVREAAPRVSVPASAQVLAEAVAPAQASAPIPVAVAPVATAAQTATAPARPKADAKAAVQPAAPPSRPVFIQPKDKMEERLRRIEEDMRKPRPRQPASGLDDKHAPIYE